MKPDWKDAPEWANYLAMDANGSWYWYERKPRRDYEDECWKPNGDIFTHSGVRAPYWEQTLEERPNEQKRNP